MIVRDRHYSRNYGNGHTFFAYSFFESEEVVVVEEQLSYYEIGSSFHFLSEIVPVGFFVRRLNMSFGVACCSYTKRV